MKKKEKINWGILIFIFVFCGCLKLGMHLDLENSTYPIFYPNDLNTYQWKSIPSKSDCVSGMLRLNDKNGFNPYYTTRWRY
ncbi:MAG: hypothetical protein JKY03_14115 [Aureispira sp.]|nr:hypothetical protein [Aureispira sp.]